MDNYTERLIFILRDFNDYSLFNLTPKEFKSRKLKLLNEIKKIWFKMQDKISLKDLEKYYKLTSKALEEVKKHIVKSKKKEADEIIKMA